MLFRVATMDDLDAILALPSVYEGHDYLSFLIAGWLKDPKRIVSIALCDDAVVGLEAATLMDEGKTMLLQALRVHPEWQGQKIAQRLSAHVKDVIMAPTVLRERTALNLGNPITVSVHERQGYVGIEGTRHLILGGHLAVLSKGLEGAVDDHVCERSVEDVVADDALPSVLQVDWVPFERTAAGFSDIERVLTRSPRVFCAGDHAFMLFIRRRNDQCWCTILDASGRSVLPMMCQAIRLASEMAGVVVLWIAVWEGTAEQQEMVRADLEMYPFFSKEMEKTMQVWEKVVAQ